MSWKEDVNYEIAGVIAKHFQTDIEGVLWALANAKVPHDVLLKVYYQFQKDYRNIPTIEQLPEPEKWKLFEEAKRLSDNKDTEYLKNVCRAIYALNIILNK